MVFNLYKSLIREGAASTMPAVPDQSDFRQLFWQTDTGSLYLWSPALAAWELQSQAVAVNAGVIASTTQTRAGATQLTGTYGSVTAANASDAVGLPAITHIGQQYLVSVIGSNAVKVFPDSGTPGASTTIDGGTAAASVTVTNAKSALFTATTLTNWQSIGMATRAA